MKLLCFLLVILVFVSAPVGAQRDSSGLIKPYGIKSCKIVYQFFNGPQSGIKTVIFDNYGRREKEDVVTTNDTANMGKVFAGIRQDMAKSNLPDSMQQVFGQKIPAIQHNLKIRLSTEIYTIDLDRNVGYKRAAVTLPLELSSFEQVEVGKDTILGKPCRVVVIQGAFRIWYWGKIALKKELVPKVEGLHVEEYAIEVDENYLIAPDEFKVPASVKMQ